LINAEGVMKMRCITLKIFFLPSRFKYTPIQLQWPVHRAGYLWDNSKYVQWSSNESLKLSACLNSAFEWIGAKRGDY